MQLIPRYVNRSRTIAVVNTAGFVTEYRPVYTHEIRITKGIDNLIEFRFLNADQKPVDVSGQTVKFVAYDDEQIKVLDLTGTLTAITGLVTVSIPQEDINDIPSQYLRYALYLDNGSTQTLTYADSHFGNSGTIYLDGSVFPVPRGDIDLPFTASAQILVTDDSSAYWTTDPVVAKPSGETFAFENAVIIQPAVTNQSDVTIQYTTDRYVSLGSIWTDITPTNITSDSTETRYEFNGTYNYIRVYTTQDPTTISKLILRN